MRVIGVDPGIAKLGYAILEEKDGETLLIGGGIIRTEKLKTEERLFKIYSELSKVIDDYKPYEMAIEDFVGRNIKDALKIGEARGIVLLLAKEKGIKVFEYSPTKVKRDISGYGRTDKEGMKRAIKFIMSAPDMGDDMADAVAISLCHLSERKLYGEGDRGDS